MKELIDEFFGKAVKLPTYFIELGVIDGRSKERTYEKVKDKKTGKFKKIASVGITNAELMFIHENGSPLRHIPRRPVLGYTILWANKEFLDKALDKALDKYIKSDFDESVYEQELQRACMRIESYARHMIYDNNGRLAPNAPRTIKEKGDNHPLFNTGQLARSIVCRLVKIGG